MNSIYNEDKLLHRSSASSLRVSLPCQDRYTPAGKVTPTTEAHDAEMIDSL